MKRWVRVGPEDLPLSLPADPGSSPGLAPHQPILPRSLLSW